VLLCTALCIPGCADDLEYEVKLYFDFGDAPPRDDHRIRIDLVSDPGCPTSIDNDGTAPAQGRYEVPTRDSVLYLVAREDGATGPVFRLRAWTYGPGDDGCARTCSRGWRDDAFVDGEEGFCVGDEVRADETGARHFGHEVRLGEDGCGGFVCAP
jgi:hypothetical protein